MRGSFVLTSGYIEDTRGVPPNRVVAQCIVEMAIDMKRRFHIIEKQFGAYDAVIEDHRIIVREARARGNFYDRVEHALQLLDLPALPEPTYG